MYLFLIQLGEKKNGLEENFFIFFNFILAFFSWQVLGFCAHACKKKKTLEIGVCSKTPCYASSMLMQACRTIKSLQSSLEKKKKKEMATFSHLKEWKKDDLILFPVSKLKQEYFKEVFFYHDIWQYFGYSSEMYRIVHKKSSLKRGRKLQVQKNSHFYVFPFVIFIFYTRAAAARQYCPFYTENDIRLTRYDKKRRRWRRRQEEQALLCNALLSRFSLSRLQDG